MINPAQINRNDSSNKKRNYKQGEIPFENLSEACLNKKLGIPVIYRSSYELKFIEYLERAVQSGKVKRWGSEITAIPYYDSKGKKHRYFPDFYVELIENISKNELDSLDKNQPDGSDNFSGNVRKILLEIKPKNQTKNINEQIAGKNLSLRSRKYLTNTYDINVRKWRVAQELCSQKGIEFKIITENTIWRL